MQSLTLHGLGQQPQINYGWQRAALVSKFARLGTALAGVKGMVETTPAKYAQLHLAREVAARMRDSLMYARAGQRYESDDRRTWHLRGHGTAGMTWRAGEDDVAVLNAFVQEADDAMVRIFKRNRRVRLDLEKQIKSMTEGRGLKFVLDNIGTTGAGALVLAKVSPKVEAGAAEAEAGAKVRQAKVAVGRMRETAKKTFALRFPR